MLLIAHPDDECMFFGPTVQRLRDSGVSLHLISLSTGTQATCLQFCKQSWPKSVLNTGNAAGKGTLRSQELQRACQTLQVRRSQVYVCQ